MRNGPRKPQRRFEIGARDERAHVVDERALGMMRGVCAEVARAFAMRIVREVLGDRRRAAYESFPQACAMRAQPSSSTSSDVAKEMRKCGDKPKAAPCTVATPTDSRR